MLFRSRIYLTMLALGGGVVGLGAIAAPPAARSAETVVHVHKSPTCGCCTAWEKHLRKHGYKVKSHADDARLTQVRTASGIPRDLGSCHTAMVDGYVVEGHVPAEAIDRLLAERPSAVGLTVPGMPVGSPGMEHPSGLTEAYDVLLVQPDGSTTPWMHIQGS